MLLHKLEPYLFVATAGAQARSREWEKNPAPEIPPDELPGFLRENVWAYGDAGIVPVVVAALTLAPPRVRHAAVDECAFVGVGRTNTAWFGSGVYLTREGRRLRQQIVLGPAADVAVCLHEIGHFWTSDPVADDQNALICVQGEAGFRDWAAEHGWLDRMDQATARKERLADALATIWLDERDHLQP